MPPGGVDDAAARGVPRATESLTITGSARTPSSATAATVFPAAREFVHAHLSDAKASEYSRKYRFEHCLRVARIGHSIAEAEGLDADLLALGCLLHDVGKYDATVPVDHGRAGALTAADFLREQGLPAELIAELAQGIAMHTDGLYNPRTDGQGTDADAAGRPYLRFKSDPSVLARSIGDCDNLDRFSAYRIGDSLRYAKFYELETAEQQAWLERYLGALKNEYDYECATETAQKRWIAVLDYQRGFFSRLWSEISE